MAILDKGSPARDMSFSGMVNDERYRAVFYQIVVFGLIAWGGWYLVSNTSHNLASRGMSSGFGFLGNTAGFDIAWFIIPYDPRMSYGRVFLVGITNTLIVSLIAIVFTTVLGFIIGILRLSKNWLIAKLAAWYVELLRNTPLLLQILFWYLAVFSLLPRPRDSVSILEVFQLNNRGFYFPSPVPGELFWLTMLAVLIAIAGTYALNVWSNRRQAETGIRFPVLWPSLAILFLLPGLVFLASGTPLSFTYPVLQGFNFVGGTSVPPAFCALFVALVVYHSAFIGENVRAGIQSVSHGQTEASHSLGLKPTLTFRLVIIPQAMRAIIPPLISAWMNVVKNSSLAIAIGFPDLVAVFMQTSLNQSGHAIEIVAMVMAFYMVVSLTISAALNVYNKSVQLKER
ncbi:MAG: amino acid ABC transporter permease [Alphaproteobacteria bacterium]|nr:amino acid ABC transporter permease [Alphaproteobacteria bacterium]MBU0797981.1 amino acid ABC transporter permease [Alphaproteobacteria bacterium]MBU0887947.1 amino acid ABC transporter permease [Alphaproteobacteria bacterium]MBU1814830.1 amino acid ABC transporter permease [Alphaproteobacteria bacterium]MBU2089327.1 amino acid ABC transporter permease [Alphaproteobacteria bacterium]